MMALAGVIPFAGFWSKDEILHSAHKWSGSQIPFYLGVIGAFLTAFYMTRQMAYVFSGQYRGNSHHEPHESPRVMTVPLAILAVFAVVLGFIGTPAWPWFHEYLTGHHEAVNWSEVLPLMLVSTIIVAAGIGLGWKVYAKAASKPSAEVDPLEVAQPSVFRVLQNKFYIDELYEATIIRLNAALSKFSDWLDRAFWGGAVKLVSYVTLGFSWINRTIDEGVINLGFDHGCDGVRDGSRFFSKLQDGQIQNYLRTIGVALAALLLLLLWS
jgi:NADH-quinone oxidoreductase subunit L